MEGAAIRTQPRPRGYAHLLSGEPTDRASLLQATSKGFSRGQVCPRGWRGFRDWGTSLNPGVLCLGSREEPAKVAELCHLPGTPCHWPI